MSLYSSLTQVLAPFAAKINGLLTGWDGTRYQTPGEAVRQQIADLHVLIGDVPGEAIAGSAVSYDGTSSDLSATNLQAAVDETNEKFTSVNGRLGELGNTVTTSLMLNNVLPWEQGYWAIADGTPRNASTWIRSKDFVADDIKNLSSTNDIIVYIQAWNKSDGLYVGTWNGSEWSTTYTAGTGLGFIDIDAFRNDYPDYKFKLTCISKDTPARNITPSDGLAIYVLISTASAQQIIDNKSASQRAMDIIKNDFQIQNNVALTITAGQFINATNNNIATDAGFGMTNPIPVKAGQKITLIASGYSNVVGMIAVCNADNTLRETKVPSVDSTEHSYVYTVEADGYIVCSFKTTQPYSLSIDVDFYKYVPVLNDNIIFAGTEVVTPGVGVVNAYINATNNTVAESNNYAISGTIKLHRGQKLTLEAYGYSTTTGMICAYDADSDTYTTLISSSGSGSATYEYTATKTVAIRCSYNKNNPVSFTVTTPESRFIALDNEEETENEYPIQYPQIFDNIVFVGDSLTYGHDGNTRLAKNYPYFFGKLADCEISNQGLSGRTAKQWWDELGVSFDFTGYDCAVIYLGTNQGLTDTVDTDCNASDYTQNADTNTGCYGKIIGKIKATNSNCKIFLIAGPEEYHSRITAMNPAVRSLAEFYQCGLIDMEDSILSDDGSTTSAERKLYRPVDGIHYDTLGYLTFANIAYDLMTKWISAHLANYKN
jgi:lysophospholipase L1-like esterase